MKLSYIIVTYNSIDLIEDCINSIVKHNVDFEIIIVDNSPEDSSRMLFSYLEEQFPNVMKFKNRDNLGYGHANNLGVEYASGDIICVMNPDVRLLERTDLPVIREFRRDSNLCMLGFKQVGGLDLSFYIRPEFFIPLLNNVAVKALNSMGLFNKTFCYLSGALIFMSRDKFVKIGLFDENIFMYNEEADVTKRALQNNYNVKYKGNLRYSHLIGNRNEFSKFSHDASIKSLEYYLRKYRFSLLKQLRLRLVDYKLRKKLAFYSKNKSGSLNQYINNLEAILLNIRNDA